MSDAPTTAALPLDRPVHRLDAADLRRALAAGFDDFRAIPTQLVFLGLIYPVIGFVAARAATGGLLPLLFPLCAGISLMGPVMAVGLYEISRRREAGLPVAWTSAFAVLRAPAIGSIAVAAVLLLATFVAWLWTARAILDATLGLDVPTTAGPFLHAVLHTPAGHALVLCGNLAGAAFAVLVMATSTFALPMLLDRDCTLVTAVRTSVRVALRNPAPMLAWGILVAALLALGSLPAFVGLAVVMPILGHATWHLYRRAVD